MDPLHQTQPNAEESRRLNPRPSGGPNAPAHTLLKRYATLLGCALAVLTADQLLKALVVRSLQHGRVVDLFGGLIRIDFTRNSGAAFGMFQSGGLLFALVAILVSIGILIFYRRIADSPVPIRLALGLILGGALGNLVDRVRLGYVVDFVDLRWWYVFNLADSAIVVGVAILLLFSSLDSRFSAK